MMLSYLSALPPLLLLAGAGYAFCRKGHRPAHLPRIVQIIAVVALLAAMAAAIFLAGFGAKTAPIAEFGLSIRLDVLSATMILLVAFIGWVVLRYAGRYLDGEMRQGAFLGWMAATLAAVLILVQAGDLITFTAAWIATSLCLHRLLLFYPERPAARRAARKKFIIARMGDGALIGAAILLGIACDSIDIGTILERAATASTPAIQCAAGLLALAALLKSAQFPSHGWLIEVMEAPTPVSALLHAGVINAGGFLLIRFADVMILAPGILAFLVMLGGFTALFGSLAMLAQPAVKTSLAWSTIAQMGFMIMQCGLALFPLALLHIVLHSLYKAHAFLSSGGAVERIASIRRPGPVAIPGARAVLQSFAAAIAIYAAIGLAFGLEGKSPQALALGAILILGMAYLLAQGLADAAPRALTRRTALYAVAASVSYFLLHRGAEWLTRGTLPPPPVPGPLEWALLALAITSFGLVALAQSTFPLWSAHPAVAGVRVHLANGLYIHAVWDRLIGQWPGRQANRAEQDNAVMITQPMSGELASDALMRAIDAAGRQIPPLWPLAAQVAVNPYLGQSDLRLAEAAARLQRVGAGPLTMPRDWYRERLADGRLTDDDLSHALAASPYRDKPESLAALKAELHQPRPECKILPTLADLAAEISGMDWPTILAERIGMWAGSRFDAGQALWGTARGRNAFADYRAFAMHDITPEIMGLRGFAAFVADAPESAEAAIARAMRRLGVSDEAVQSYAHHLLMTLGGWSHYARHLLWRAELAGQNDDTLTAMLAIRLVWEEALFQQYEAQITEAWGRVRAAHAIPAEPGQAEIVDEILQEAAEHAAQRDLAKLLAAEPVRQEDGARPALQAAFCIDVRSEVFRRALETVDPSIRTLGFAGFFGIAAGHRGFASDVEELRLPVLLNPSLHSCATASGQKDADTDTRLRARAHRAWGRFKLAAVSSFAFVEAAGPIYAAKLIRDAFGLRGVAQKVQPQPHFQPGLALSDRIRTAETVLRAMSLTGGFARIVLLAGHGAHVTNNPHASALQCGACGGYSGEVNARLLAGLLNDLPVREGLVGRGIDIPQDTLFLAGLHDTTTDRVTLFDGDCDTAAHREDIAKVRGWLASAGRIARTERAARLPHAAGHDIEERARNWAEIRPEWGLAGCSAFIAAPRSRTTGRDLGGRAFLHDYDWRQDGARGFTVLELILTAPVVVASWISLQYYGSTVAPQVFGAGNKLLHNVVGGIGVVEGNGGLLRSGLAWQSVHDGQKYRHDPLRLSVCIEAPRDAMSAILKRHAHVRALFDHGWLHLFALDDAGRMAWRYTGNLSWVSVDGMAPGPEDDTRLDVAAGALV